MHPLTAAAMTGAGGVGAATAGSAMDPRIKPAAHEFEACLMKEFLKPLEKDPLFSEDGDSDSGGSSDGSGSALMSFGSEALARALSDRGGFGIATKIIDHFEPRNCQAGKAGTAMGSVGTGPKI
jgi:peptidoglycan hydrolase FlgJ